MSAGKRLVSTPSICANLTFSPHSVNYSPTHALHVVISDQEVQKAAAALIEPSSIHEFNPLYVGLQREREMALTWSDLMKTCNNYLYPHVRKKCMTSTDLHTITNRSKRLYIKKARSKISLKSLVSPRYRTWCFALLVLKMSKREKKLTVGGVGGRGVLFAVAHGVQSIGEHQKRTHKDTLSGCEHGIASSKMKVGTVFIARTTIIV